MSQNYWDMGTSPAALAPEADEVGPAVRDVSYNLAHDPSDRPQDIRDAAAAAPLIAIKIAQRFAAAVTQRPECALAVLVALLGVALIKAPTRHRPRN